MADEAILKIITRAEQPSPQAPSNGAANGTNAGPAPGPRAPIQPPPAAEAVQAAPKIAKSFDAHAEALKQIEADRKREQIEAEKAKLKPPPEFNATTEALKQIEADRKREAVETEKQRILGPPKEPVDFWEKARGLLAGPVAAAAKQGFAMGGVGGAASAAAFAGLGTIAGPLAVGVGIIAVTAEGVLAKIQREAKLIDAASQTTIQAIIRDKDMLDKQTREQAANLASMTGAGPLFNLLRGRDSQFDTLAKVQRALDVSKALRAEASTVAPFSPPVATAEAQAEVARINRQRIEARFLGPDFGRLIEMQTQRQNLESKQALLQIEKEVRESRKLEQFRIDQAKRDFETQVKEREKEIRDQADKDEKNAKDQKERDKIQKQMADDLKRLRELAADKPADSPWLDLLNAKVPVDRRDAHIAKERAQNEAKAGARIKFPAFRGP